MKEGWEIRKLKEFCEFKNGLWKGKKPPFQEVGVIRNTNFTRDGQLDDSNIAYINVEQSQFSKRRLQCGDIILEKSGGGPKQPVGRVIIFDKKNGDFSFSNFTSIIRIKDNENIDFKYLHRYLFFAYVSGKTESMQKHSTGIRNLRFKEYKEIQVPIPPLPEQHRIVSILDKAFSAIDKAKANAEQNLKNAKEVFESYLQGVFTSTTLSNPLTDSPTKRDGWEEKKLGEITIKTPRGGKKSYKEEGISLIRSMNVHDREFKEHNLAFIDEKQAKELDNVTIQKDDVLLNITGASVARCCIVPEALLPARVNQHVSIIRIKEDFLNPQFLNYLLTSKPYKDQLLFIGEQGATRQAITKSQIENLKISFPILNEQKRLVRQLDTLQAETQKMEYIYLQKIANLEELKKSILQKAFSGELTNLEVDDTLTPKAELI